MARPCDSCGQPTVAYCGLHRAAVCRDCLPAHNWADHDKLSSPGLSPRLIAELTELLADGKPLADPPPAPADPFCRVCWGGGKLASGEACHCTKPWYKRWQQPAGCADCDILEGHNLHSDSCDCPCHQGEAGYISAGV